LAVLEGSEVENATVLMLGLVDESLASFEATNEDVLPLFGDEIVLIGELGVCGVLLIRVGQTISNSDTLQVQLDIGGIESEVVRDGGDVVTGIGLTSDVKVASLELGVLDKEASEHVGHVLGDLSLGSGVVETTLGEASADGLVNVEQVGDGVPGVRVALQGGVWVELVRTVLVEEGNLRGAARAAGEPKDERVGGGLVAGLEHPVEDIVIVGVDLDGTSLPLLSITEDSGGVVSVGVGVGYGGHESEGFEHRKNFYLL
jgi:hypothetical protein